MAYYGRVRCGQRGERGGEISVGRSSWNEDARGLEGSHGHKSLRAVVSLITLRSYLHGITVTIKLLAAFLGDICADCGALLAIFLLCGRVLDESPLQKFLRKRISSGIDIHGFFNLELKE